MLKIKDNVELKELDFKFDLEQEIIDADYESGFCGDIEHYRDGVFISLRNRQIYGIDCSDLDLLYDLIKADLVEKVEK